MYRLIPLVAMVACGGGGEPAECETGFETGSDGLCYQTTGATTGDTGGPTSSPADDPIRAYLDAIEPCTLPAGDGMLDLAAGCADGMCVGMTYDEMVAAYGSDAVCDLIDVTFGTFVFRYLDCAWSNGVSTSFDDEDEDGVPDPLDTAFSLSVERPFAGTTTDGLGLDVGMDCFVPILGMPTTVDFERVLVSDFQITGLHYEVPYFYAYDWEGDGPYDFGPNGEADNLTLYGNSIY